MALGPLLNKACPKVAAGGKLSLWEQDFATLLLFFHGVSLREPHLEGGPVQQGMERGWSEVLRCLSRTLSLQLVREVRGAEGCSCRCRSMLKGGSGMLSWRAARSGQVSADDDGPGLKQALSVLPTAQLLQPCPASSSTLCCPFPSHQLNLPISSTAEANLVARINGSDQRTANTGVRGNVIWKSLISQVCVALKMVKKA